MTTQITRQYKNANVARHEIQKMARQGYTVISMTEVQQRSGLGRFLLLGIFAAVFHPRPRVLVVYSTDNVAPTPTMNERIDSAKATYDNTVNTLRSAYSWVADKTNNKGK